MSRSTALIVLDLQNDFLSPEGAYARGGVFSADARALPARVAPVARAVKSAGGYVAASLFTLWPDAKGEPMISNHLRRLRPFLGRGDFVAGSVGHRCVDDFDGLIDASVLKVSYSAFFNTQLDWLLRRAGINHLAISGIVTNGAVASTVRDAHVRDYQVTVLSDGCAAPLARMHDAALADLCTVADISTCQEFITGLER